MTVYEAIQELFTLRETKRDELTTQEYHALEIARAVLISLDSPQREMIDTILAMPDYGNN